METLIVENKKTQKVNTLPGDHQAIMPVLNLLKYTFVIVPIVAGLDKFTNLLANWDKYLHPGLTGMLPLPVHTFMMIVGVIEIAAGIIVFLRPAIGGLIVAAWLALIALTLLLGGNYLNVAVRDLVMSVSAFSMARIFMTVHKKNPNA